MASEVNQERQQAHALLDLLPAERLAEVRSLLQIMVEPLSRLLEASPIDEDEISVAMAAALERARASVARGESIPHEDILREFGRKE